MHRIIFHLITLAIAITFLLDLNQVWTASPTIATLLGLAFIVAAAVQGLASQGEIEIGAFVYLAVSGFAGVYFFGQAILGVTIPTMWLIFALCMNIGSIVQAVTILVVLHRTKEVVSTEEE